MFSPKASTMDEEKMSGLDERMEVIDLKLRMVSQSRPGYTLSHHKDRLDYVLND